MAGNVASLSPWPADGTRDCLAATPLRAPLTRLPAAREPNLGELPKLTEVGNHGVLVETVRDVPASSGGRESVPQRPLPPPRQTRANLTHPIYTTLLAGPGPASADPRSGRISSPPPAAPFFPIAGSREALRCVVGMRRLQPMSSMLPWTRCLALGASWKPA